MSVAGWVLQFLTVVGLLLSAVLVERLHQRQVAEGRPGISRPYRVILNSLAGFVLVFFGLMVLISRFV